LARWWWFGGAMTREEITRELTFMRDAGLEGVEFQPVYPVAVDNPQLGIRNTLRLGHPFSIIQTILPVLRLGSLAAICNLLGGDTCTRP
jgi:hypothetical protein